LIGFFLIIDPELIHQIYFKLLNRYNSKNNKGRFQTTQMAKDLGKIILIFEFFNAQF